MAQSNYLNRANLISNGTPTYWLAQDYDLDMSEHPSQPNASLYNGFTICGRVPVVVHESDTVQGFSETPMGGLMLQGSDDFILTEP